MTYYIISSEKYCNKINEDILLRDSFIKMGFNSKIVSWESFEDYKESDILIIRSIWGYHEKYNIFIKWLDNISNKNIKVVNKTQLIRKTVNKEEQFDILAKNNIPLIPFEIIKRKESLLNRTGEFVIKPSISGSGYMTKKVSLALSKDSEINIIDEWSDIFENDNMSLILQPYFKGIEKGEYSCFFIRGENTHNIIRFPGVLTIRKEVKIVSKIPKFVLDVATKVSKINDFEGYVFMRVDLVVEKGKPYVIEVELIDPDFMTRKIKNLKKKEEIIKKFALAILK